MAQFKHQATLSYTPAQMYALVNDVAAYPEFLPWCGASAVYEHSETHMKGSLTLKKGSIEKTIKTSNTLVPSEKITMQLVDGPFKNLQGVWQFKSVPHGCHIEFTLDIDFGNRLTALFFEPFFAKIADTILNAFEARAKLIYGSSHAN